jgi:hypothetical protein
MAEELITPENLSKEMLKSILDASFMETSLDDDGDIIVKEGLRCWVLPEQERKDRVQLLTFFRFKQEISELQRLQAVNRINTEYVIIKAAHGKNNALRFTYDISVAGGITKKAFVLVLKRFCGIPRAAINELAGDLVE